MMDLSDGLKTDLQRICKASRCAAEIKMEKLPLSSAFKKVCLKYNWNKLEEAALGGEDYCLLLMADHKNLGQLLENYEKKISPKTVCHR